MVRLMLAHYSGTYFAIVVMQSYIPLKRDVFTFSTLSEINNVGVSKYSMGYLTCLKTIE